MIKDGYTRALFTYSLGFTISLILTFVSYFLVMDSNLRGFSIMIAVGVLALSQMIIQLIFFLHLHQEGRPRLKLAAFLSMALILIMIVVGSLWIMSHLNYNMMHMTPSQKNDYMETQKGGGF